MGELPPYFVARAASAAGGIDEELEDILNKDDGNDNSKVALNGSWAENQKKRLASFLKNYAFMTVLLMASVSLTYDNLICRLGSNFILFHIVLTALYDNLIHHLYRWRICTDPEPSIRLGRVDVWTLPTTLHDFLHTNLDREGREQSLNTSHLHHRGLL